VRRGLRLEYATLGWNVVGAAVTALSAIAARSVALAGFGLDSVIEIVASVVVVWQLTGGDAARERRALRIIGWAFVAAAAYIVAQTVYAVAAGIHPAPSRPGLAWLSATLVAMLILAHEKRQTGRALHHAVLETEARVTLVDAGLAAAVLLGLALNAWFGWWWADPAAGLVIVAYAAREAWTVLRGR
jgi:divalent metal cation (Fe/Co/Zn/Cd) transporter